VLATLWRVRKSDQYIAASIRGGPPRRTRDHAASCACQTSPRRRVTRDDRPRPYNPAWIDWVDGELMPRLHGLAARIERAEARMHMGSQSAPAPALDDPSRPIEEQPPRALSLEEAHAHASAAVAPNRAKRMQELAGWPYPDNQKGDDTNTGHQLDKYQDSNIQQSSESASQQAATSLKPDTSAGPRRKLTNEQPHGTTDAALSWIKAAKLAPRFQRAAESAAFRRGEPQSCCARNCRDETNEGADQKRPAKNLRRMNDADATFRTST
jgi:hypothetical protein